VGVGIEQLHDHILGRYVRSLGRDRLPIWSCSSLYQHVLRNCFLEFDRFEISNDSLGGFFPIRTIRKGNMKLVINLLDMDELYDMHADPGELDNVINDPAFETIRDSLHDELLQWMYERRDPFRSPQWERRSWRESRQFGWWGDYRLVPQDGYITDVRDYFTGKVMTRGALQSADGRDEP